MVDDRKPKEQQDLPEGWKWVKLGEILKFLKGKTPRKLYDYEDEGMTIYLTPEYLRKNKCDVAFCKKEGTLLANEDIVILWDGSNAGEVFWAEKGAVASTMAKIDITSSDFPIYKKFLYYYLKSNELAFKYQVKGSGIPHFEKDILNTLNSIFPPLPEQRKIAQILETVDNVIEKTEKIIEKYKRIKQGLMQDLLTKGIDENGNIRSERTHKFKDSPLGRIPEEWEVVRLGEVSKVKRGASPRPIDDPIFFTEEGKGRAWVRIEDVMESNKYLTETRQYLSKLGEAKSVKVDVGDVVMSICATIGKPIIINIPACIHDGFVVFKNLSYKVDRHFLYYLITFKEKEIAKLGQIGTQGNLNSKIVSNFLIPLPPLSEQKRIAEILSQIDQAIEKEEKYKQKLERLKKGLMEDLLTGKVRVNKLLEGENHGMA